MFVAPLAVAVPAGAGGQGAVMVAAGSSFSVRQFVVADAAGAGDGAGDGGGSTKEGAGRPCNSCSETGVRKERERRKHFHTTTEELVVRVIQSLFLPLPVLPGWTPVRCS